MTILAPGVSTGRPGGLSGMTQTRNARSSGRTLSTDPDTWRIVDDATGRVLRSGATPPYPRVPTAKP